MDAYSGTYDIRWADLDANGHVHYSAYLDAAADLKEGIAIAAPPHQTTRQTADPPPP